MVGSVPLSPPGQNSTPRIYSMGRQFPISRAFFPLLPDPSGSDSASQILDHDARPTWAGGSQPTGNAWKNAWNDTRITQRDGLAWDGTGSVGCVKFIPREPMEIHPRESTEVSEDGSDTLEQPGIAGDDGKKNPGRILGEEGLESAPIFRRKGLKIGMSCQAFLPLLPGKAGIVESRWWEAAEKLQHMEKGWQGKVPRV